MTAHLCVAHRLFCLFGRNEGSVVTRARKSPPAMFFSSVPTTAKSLKTAKEQSGGSDACGRVFRRVYWFDPESRSPSIELPSGKKCFVFNAKRDQDGELEPVLCFVDRYGRRLMWMDGEELCEFEKLVPATQLDVHYVMLGASQIPRLEEYFKLCSQGNQPNLQHEDD